MEKIRNCWRLKKKNYLSVGKNSKNEIATAIGRVKIRKTKIRFVECFEGGEFTKLINDP